jgi:hypothetical protein
MGGGEGARGRRRRLLALATPTAASTADRTRLHSVRNTLNHPSELAGSSRRRRDGRRWGWVRGVRGRVAVATRSAAVGASAGGQCSSWDGGGAAARREEEVLSLHACPESAGDDSSASVLYTAPSLTCYYEQSTSHVRYPLVHASASTHPAPPRRNLHPPPSRPGVRQPPAAIRTVGGQGLQGEMEQAPNQRS